MCRTFRLPVCLPIRLCQHDNAEQDKRNKKKKKADGTPQQQQQQELFVGLFRDEQGTQ